MLFFNFFRAIILQNTRGEPPTWFTGMILWTSKNLSKSSCPVTALLRHVDYFRVARDSGARKRKPLYSIIPLWLSLFSSEESMLADTGRFVRAFSPKN